MPGFDNALGLHEVALKLRAQRMETLSSNLANADTPNYKARDIDFKAVLKKAEGEGVTSQKLTNKAHIKVDSSNQYVNDLMYRIPAQPSLDNNTVDMDIEKAAFSNNSMAYQISMTFLNGKIKGIMSAIRGD